MMNNQSFDEKGVFDRVVDGKISIFLTAKLRLYIKLNLFSYVGIPSSLCYSKSWQCSTPRYMGLREIC